jgi:hypothetical protein
VKATRRSALTASGLAVLGLAGCTADEPASSSSDASPSTSQSVSGATETAAPDPDQVALDRAVALTASLLAALEEANPVIDPAGRLAAIHEAHLVALQEAAGAAFTPLPSPSGRRLTAARLRRRELDAQRELARLAQAAESGALARVFASMSAGIAAGLSHRGEVPR